jgi:hypothetical protein
MTFEQKLERQEHVSLDQRHLVGHVGVPAHLVLSSVGLVNSKLKLVNLFKSLKRKVNLCLEQNEGHFEHFLWLIFRLFLNLTRKMYIFSLLVSEGVIIDSRTDPRSRISLPWLTIINQGQ